MSGGLLEGTYFRNGEIDCSASNASEDAACEASGAAREQGIARREERGAHRAAAHYRRFVEGMAWTPRNGAKADMVSRIAVRRACACALVRQSRETKLAELRALKVPEQLCVQRGCATR